MINTISTLSIQNFKKSLFCEKINEDGYVIVEDVISKEMCDYLREDLQKAIREEDKFHGTSNRKEHAMLLACPIYGGSFLDILEVKHLIEPFNWVLGETSIIYVYTSSSMPPQSTNYSNRIHVDRPHFIPGFIESLGCIIMIDDFTESNGATWILPKSHSSIVEPDKESFYSNAIQATGKKGSVLYFNLRLWHSGGFNYTNEWRHSLGIGFVRGYLKQKIDLPRAMIGNGIDISRLTPNVKQKLGFYS